MCDFPPPDFHRPVKNVHVTLKDVTDNFKKPNEIHEHYGRGVFWDAFFAKSKTGAMKLSEHYPPATIDFIGNLEPPRELRVSAHRPGVHGDEKFTLELHVTAESEESAEC